MAKDSLRTTAGELQKIVESWGSENLFYCQTARFKKNYPSSSKNKLQHMQLLDMTET